MTTLANLEIAADALTEAEKQELLLFLAASLRRARLSAARQIADAKSKSIGEVISELARRGLEARAKVTASRLSGLSGYDRCATAHARRCASG
jgi:hypothetical protein